MPLKYKPTKYAIAYDPKEDMTEQEHKDSCDINIMLKKAAQGQEVRGGPKAVYGFDDTNFTGIDLRILKQQTEEELAQIAETHEFSEEELKLIDPSIKEKFGFKMRKTEPTKQTTTIKTTTNETGSTNTQETAEVTQKPVEQPKS